MSDGNDNDFRKFRNEQLIRRMKAGEPLWSYDSKASWFPPRPIIEKDASAIKRLYETTTTANHDSKYSDSTVRHIESRLTLISGDKKDEIENVG